MGLDEVIARLQSKVAVTDVTDVTVNTSNGESCHGSPYPAVTNVTNTPIDNGNYTSVVTVVTSPHPAAVTQKALPHKDVTDVTAVTGKNGSQVAPAPLENGSLNSALSTSHWWLIHYADGCSKKVRFSANWTIAEVLEMYSGATVIEPDISVVQTPDTPLNTHQEQLLRAWLALIEETDLLLINQTIEQCGQDPEAREYFLGRAIAELPKPDSLDDRRPCTLCANFVQNRCRARHVWYCPNTKTLPQRCKDYRPLPWDPNQRHGYERWSL